MKKITPLQYAIFLYELATQKTDTGKLAQNFLKILAKNSDLWKVEGIIKEFEKYDKKQKGIRDVEIISASVLDNQTRNSILDAVGEKSKLHIRETVDHNLLGGLVVTVEDMMIDGSLRKKIKDLGQALI